MGFGNIWSSLFGVIRSQEYDKGYEDGFNECRRLLTQDIKKWVKKAEKVEAFTDTTSTTPPKL